jgi:acyl carrier protein
VVGEIMTEEQFAAVTRIDELNMDSLDHIEMLMAIEEEFEIEISDDDAETWSTIDGIVEYLMAATSSKPNSALKALADKHYSSPIDIRDINEPGKKYSLLDTDQTVIWTGKPHDTGNVHVCALGTGDTFWVDPGRLRHHK